MNMCGVVQNESRPTLSCQEISHAPPMVPEAMAMRQLQIYQGMLCTPATARSFARVLSECGRGRVWAMGATSGATDCIESLTMQIRFIGRSLFYAAFSPRSTFE